MKTPFLTSSICALTVAIGINSALSQDPSLSPSKVTGGGSFYNTGWDPNNPPIWPAPNANYYEAVQFELSVQPATSGAAGLGKAAKGAKAEKPAKASIWMDSPSLREFLGGKPLELEGEPVQYVVIGAFWQDSKPDQECWMLLNEAGEVTTDWSTFKYLVGVGFNDNGTPGFNADMGRADWIWVWFWVPEANEVVFGQSGMLFEGNIMDHRK